MMASEAQRWAVTISGWKRRYSSRSTSASMKSTSLSWACSASRRASLMAAGSRSRPATCVIREASQNVSRPVPQPTSSPRMMPRLSASSRPRNLGETGKLLGLEVLRLWVVEHEGRDRGLGVHHEAFGQPEADLRWLEEVEEDALIGEVRTGGIAERDPEAAVVRLEPVLHGHAGRIREAPLGPQPRVEHLRQRFGQLDGEGLDSMRAEVLALLLPALGELADALSARDGEERDIVRLGRGRVARVVGETEALAALLAREGEACDLAPVTIENEVVVRRARLEEAVERIGLQPPLLHDLPLQLLDGPVDLQGLGVPVGEEALDRALHAQVLAEEHLEVEIGIDVRRGHPPEHVEIEVGRLRHRRLARDRRACRHWPGRRRLRHHLGPRAQPLLLGAEALDEALAGGGAEEPVGEVEAIHGVLGIERGPTVLHGDPRGRELARQGGPAHEEGDLDTRGPQVLGGGDHLLG